MSTCCPYLFFSARACASKRSQKNQKPYSKKNSLWSNSFLRALPPKATNSHKITSSLVNLNFKPPNFIFWFSFSNYSLKINLSVLTFSSYLFFCRYKRSKKASKTHIFNFLPFADKFCQRQKVSKATFQPFGIEKTGKKSKIAYFLTSLNIYEAKNRNIYSHSIPYRGDFKLVLSIFENLILES